jgi:glycosyl transferase family 87
MPPRYGLIALGSALLMIGSAAFVPLGPQANAPWRELVTLFTCAGGLALLFGASLTTPAPANLRRRNARWRHVALVVALPLTLGTLFVNSGSAALALYDPPSQSYVTDVVSFTALNAHLALRGRNPYTSGDHLFTQTLSRFPHAAGSPLRGRTFGTSLDHPAPEWLLAAQRQYVRHPHALADAFDPRTLHSYPALSFLVYVPLLWAGLRNILFLDAAIYWLMFAWLVWLAPIGWRHWAALIGLAAMPVMAASLVESIDIVGIALALLAWHMRDRRWLSSGLFGLALAYKQLVWFFIPFFALEILMTYGWRETLKRGALVAGAFLLPNLPYIIASPRAWFTSMWLPMSEPLFAEGMGIITLSISHIIPYAPPLAYALLELAALGVALWAYVRWRGSIGDGVLILALLPIFFAMRSMPSYFAFTPWFALYAVNRIYAQRVAPQPSPVVDLAARAPWAIYARCVRL